MSETLRLMEQLFGSTSYGGVGIVLLAGLLLTLRLFLPPDQRGLLRLPLGLALLHLVVIVARAALPRGLAAVPLATVAMFLLQLALARGTFLLIFRSSLARGAQATSKIFQDIVQGVLYVGAVLLSLQAAGVEPGSILTTSALLTAVIGLSLQETLGNLFAGLALQATVPFEVGDWITLDDNPALTGRVVEINWRATKILTNDELEIVIPNGALAKANIRNFTKPSPIARRNVAFFSSYGTPPGQIEGIVLAAIEGTPGVLASPAPAVHLVQFAESRVEYLLHFYTDQFERRAPIESAVRARIWYALQRAGLAFPMPIRDVRVTGSAEALALSHEPTLASLRGVDVLAVLPPEALARLATLVERRLYGPGEVILRQGEIGDELFLIEQGRVRVVVGREGGSTAELTSLGPGQFFGEMSLMTGERRAATIQAISDCRLLVVRKEAFQQALAAHPEVTERISEILLARQEQLGSHLASRSRRAQPTSEQRDELVGRIRRFFSL
jgi:small-conductance mechanosensitive channel/CRP-like cAMP-binding protein